MCVCFLRLLEFGFYLNFAVAEFVLCATAAAREKRVELKIQHTGEIMICYESARWRNAFLFQHTHISPWPAQIRTYRNCAGAEHVHFQLLLLFLSCFCLFSRYYHAFVCACSAMPVIVWAHVSILISCHHTAVGKVDEMVNDKRKKNVELTL